MKHPMTAKIYEDLYDAFDACCLQYATSQAELDQHNALPRPAWANSYPSFESLVDDWNAVDKHRRARKKLAFMTKEAYEKRERAAKKLGQYMPLNIWVRHGNHALRVEPCIQGGSKYQLVVGDADRKKPFLQVRF